MIIMNAEVDAVSMHSVAMTASSGPAAATVRVRTLSHLPPMYECCGCFVPVETLGVGCTDDEIATRHTIEVQLVDGELLQVFPPPPSTTFRPSSSSVAQSAVGFCSRPTVAIRPYSGSQRQDPAVSYSWTAFVRPARDRHEQNVEVIIDGVVDIENLSQRQPGRCAVRLRTTRNVEPGEELAVWYGDCAGRLVGVPPLGPSNIRGNQCYVCSYCPLFFRHPNPLKTHMMFNCIGANRKSSSSTAESVGRRASPTSQLELFPVWSPRSTSGPHHSLSSSFRPVGDRNVGITGNRPTPVTGHDTTEIEMRRLLDVAPFAGCLSRPEVNPLYPVETVSWSSSTDVNEWQKWAEPAPGTPIAAALLTSSMSQQPPSVARLWRCFDTTISSPAENGEPTETTASPATLLLRPNNDAVLAFVGKFSMTSLLSDAAVSAHESVADTTRHDIASTQHSHRHRTCNEEVFEPAAADRKKKKSMRVVDGGEVDCDVSQSVDVGWSVDVGRNRRTTTTSSVFERQSNAIEQQNEESMPRCSTSSSMTSSPSARRSCPSSSSLSSSSSGCSSPTPSTAAAVSGARRVRQRPAAVHRCVHCGKLYSRRYGLTIHLRTHSGDKPLECPVCRRPFGDPSNLNKHVRLHVAAAASAAAASTSSSSGEVGVSMGASGGLGVMAAAAALRAVRDSPYRCRYCGKVLVRRRDLERHIRSRHPGVASSSSSDAGCGGGAGRCDGPIATMIVAEDRLDVRL